MKINNMELIAEHSDEKKITIDDIIECVFGGSVRTVAESFVRNERNKEAS